MDLNERIKQRRKQLGMTLAEVAKATGVSEATVQRWESGIIANMRRDKIASLAEALHTSPAYLMGWAQNPEENPPLLSNIIPLEKIGYVPLVGRIACGRPILAEENIIEKILLPSHVNADFALLCQGDSMVGAGIEDSDVVFIRQQPEVENGEIAAVLIDGTDSEATLKKVYMDNKQITLMPMNSSYNPSFFSGEEMNKVRIIGKVVAVLKDLE